MADPNEAGPSSPRRSTARQVSGWLLLVSFFVAAMITGGWCFARAVPLTASTTPVVVVVTAALWATIYRLFILRIKRMVRNRIAQSRAEGA